MSLLNLQIPPFIRIDYLHIIMAKALSTGDFGQTMPICISLTLHKRDPDAGFCKLFSAYICFLQSSCMLSFGNAADERYVNWTLRVASAHGQKAPLPFIKSVEVTPSSISFP